jgi:hypothetical protein
MEQQLSNDRNNLKTQLRARLSAFIAEARSVDFDAKTQVRNGRTLFVNPAYEPKSSNWKLFFRMGREPVTAALEVAERWRQELP